MNRREFLRNAGLLTTGIVLSPLARALDLSRLPLVQGTRIAEGRVHEKGNREKGIAGVCVSNGRDVVRTDRQGRWRLPVGEDTILFVIKPSGWRTPVDADNLPRYYYLHKPKGSPTDTKYAGVAPTGDLPPSVDFALERQREDARFRMMLFGDPQPRNQTEIDYMTHDVIEQAALDARAMDVRFGLSLGDEMFNNLEFYDSLNGVIGRIGLPWYNTVGNHDLNLDAPNDALSTETFQRVYGPTYYAFDYAKVHFIVLDNVFFDGAGKGYHGELVQRQLDFVRNDLALVPKDRLVVVAMHIPLVDTDNREALYRLLEDRPHTFSLSAHTHVQAHHFVDAAGGWRGKTPHHHLNHATVCGSWWGGATDERGIPHATMSDGGHNGYSIVEFDGAEYKVVFRPASRPATDQMRIDVPELVKGPAEVVVNVFAGSERSTVEMRVAGGAWTPMTMRPGIDPYYGRLKELEKGPKPPNGRLLPEASTTRHLWAAPLPTLAKGTHVVDVRTTDMFGQTYASERIVRVA